MSTAATQSTATAGPLLTAEERARAAQYLAATCDDLNATIHGLTDQQWQFKPAADKWCIGEVVEHLTIAETRIHGLLGRIAEAQPADADRNHAAVDEFILANVPERSKKFTAPPVLQPAGQLTPQELLIRFAEARSHTLRLLDSAPQLRGRTLPHPIFGPWDGYQWLLGTAAHTARHTQQIVEIKAHPEYPAASAAASR